MSRIPFANEEDTLRKPFRSHRDSPGHQYKILLVEDDRFYCLFLKQYLERLGYSVVEAGSLSEFKLFLNAEQPDAIISDIGFAETPEPTAPYLTLGGLLALDWLIYQTHKPETVIVISSTLTERLRQQFESRGVTAIFEKPFAPDASSRVLKQAARSTDI